MEAISALSSSSPFTDRTTAAAAVAAFQSKSFSRCHGLNSLSLIRRHDRSAARNRVLRVSGDGGCSSGMARGTVGERPCSTTRGKKRSSSTVVPAAGVKAAEDGVAATAGISSDELKRKGVRNMCNGGVNFMLDNDSEGWARAVGHERTYHRRADVLPMRVAKLDAKLHEFEPAKARMVMGNLRPSRSVVKQRNCGGLEVADLIQGLTRAIADDSRTLRLPVHLHKSLRRNIRARARMLQDGDPATFDFTGEPSIPCDSCKGRGWLVCDFCEGQKVNVQSRKNRIYRRCPSCRAAGVVICPRCKVFKCISFPDERDSAL